MRVKIIKTLYNFLIKEDLLEDFLREYLNYLNLVKSYNMTDARKYYENILSGKELTYCVNNYLYTLLTWEKTNKGFDYWHQMHSKWIDYLKDNNELDYTLNDYENEF